MNLTIKNRDGAAITDWRKWSRPKKAHHWRAGRSAMELARAWFTSPEPRCPPEITEILNSHARTSGLVLAEGFPEYVTALPEKGEGRNHDLLLLAANQAGQAVVSVEAKVDETFGETIGNYWIKGRHCTSPTRVPERIRSLLSLVFGGSASADADPWQALRYQLLTAAAGTAIEAARRGASTAVLIVHEFRTESADVENTEVNADDLRDFVRTLLHQPATEVLPGRLYGPARLSQAEHLEREVDLLIGKAVYDWQPSESA